MKSKPQLTLEEDENIFTQNTHKTFFKTNPEKGFPYFNNTRVGSCSYVLVKNGQNLAIPFKIHNRRGHSLNHFKITPKKAPTLKSTYMHDFITYGDLHCGMLKKPLVPYSVWSPRSRLQMNFMVNGASLSRASVELGDFGLINRKQWKSTYKDSFRKPTIVPISNYGIASDLAKESHSRLNNS